MNSNTYLAMGLLCFALALPGSVRAEDCALGQCSDVGVGTRITGQVTPGDVGSPEFAPPKIDLRDLTIILDDSWSQERWAEATAARQRSLAAFAKGQALGIDLRELDQAIEDQTAQLMAIRDQLRSKYRAIESEKGKARSAVDTAAAERSRVESELKIAVRDEAETKALLAALADKPGVKFFYKPWNREVSLEDVTTENNTRASRRQNAALAFARAENAVQQASTALRRIGQLEGEVETLKGAMVDADTKIRQMNSDRDALVAQIHQAYGTGNSESLAAIKGNFVATYRVVVERTNLVVSRFRLTWHTLFNS